MRGQQGCITVKKNWIKGRKYPGFQLLIVVAQVDKRPLEKLRSLFGGSILQENIRKKNPCYTWYGRGITAINCLKSILPFLMVKKEEATTALEFENLIKSSGIQVTEQEREQRIIIHQKLKQMKDIKYKRL